MNRRTFLTRLGLGALCAKPLIDALADPVKASATPSGNFHLGPEEFTQEFSGGVTASDINQLFLSRKEELDLRVYEAFMRRNPWSDLFPK